jgi:hypothetical protein
MSAQAKKGGTLTAGLGVLMVLCCLAGPAVVGAVAGSAIGGWLGMLAAVVVALAVGGALTWRARSRGRAC